MSDHLRGVRSRFPWSTTKAAAASGSRNVPSIAAATKLLRPAGFYASDSALILQHLHTAPRSTTSAIGQQAVFVGHRRRHD